MTVTISEKGWVRGGIMRFGGNLRRCMIVAPAIVGSPIGVAA
jgi:hypothetical protein